jgi:hypothetical protein
MDEVIILRVCFFSCSNSIFGGVICVAFFFFNHSEVSLLRTFLLVILAESLKNTIRFTYNSQIKLQFDFHVTF